MGGDPDGDDAWDREFFRRRELDRSFIDFGVVPSMCSGVMGGGCVQSVDGPFGFDGSTAPAYLQYLVRIE